MDSSENIDLHAEPASKPRQMTARWVALGIGGLPALATFLAFGGGWYWQLDLLSHFRVQYAVILAIMAILLMFMRQWRMALLVTLPLTVNVALILPLYVHPSWLVPHPEFASQQKSLGTPLKLMSYNMGGIMPGNEDPMELIRNSDADIVVLQDVRPKMLDQLEYAVAPFRVYISDARADGYGVAILHRVSIRPQVVLEEAKLIHLTKSDSLKLPFAIQAQLRWQGRGITLLTLKAASPLTQRSKPTQLEQFKALGRWVHEQTDPVVVIGDLNTSPWSYAFTQLLQDTGLVNSQLGFGIQGSWPATGGSLGQIPVDHCLISTSLITSSRKLGPSYQSSHHALMVELRWASGANDIIHEYNDEEYQRMNRSHRGWHGPRDGRERRGSPKQPSQQEDQQAAQQEHDNQPSQQQPAASAAKPEVKPQAKPVAKPVVKPKPSSDKPAPAASQPAAPVPAVPDKQP